MMESVALWILLCESARAESYEMYHELHGSEEFWSRAAENQGNIRKGTKEGLSSGVRIPERTLFSSCIYFSASSGSQKQSLLAT